jgi:hypothetical protein
MRASLRVAKPSGLSARVCRSGVMAFAACFAALSVPTAAGTVRRTSSSAMRDLGPGAWCWFQGPRGVYANGQTFVGYVSAHAQVMVASVGAEGVRHFALAQEPSLDDHDSPALAVLPDGRLAAYYTQHVGPALHWRVSTRPYDITAWSPEQTLNTNVTGVWGDTYTYPHPVWLSAENRAFLFWRGGNILPDISLGPTLTGPWTPARTLISVSNNQRPYVIVADNARDTIFLAYTNANPREGVSSLFFAEYRAGSLRHADGRPITSLNRVPMPAWNGDVLWNAHVQRERAWVWDTAFSTTGRPVVVFATFRNQEREHVYHWDRWTGRRWEDHILAQGGGTITTDPDERWYSGGIVLDPRDPDVTYASIQVRGRFEIARFVTHDGGAHWSRQWITWHSHVDNVRPDVPQGLPTGRDELIWMRGTYNTYTQFHTSVWTRGA